MTKLFAPDEIEEEEKKKQINWQILHSQKTKIRFLENL